MTRTFPHYDVVIRRVSDGVERVFHSNVPWVEDDEREGDWFWWSSDGNMGCDCNLYLSFERAGGNNPAIDDPACECSDGKYLVMEFRFPDGTALVGPGAE
jgi:hypothetical protein